MAERIKLFNIQEIQNVTETVFNPTTGLETRVADLEDNPEATVVLPYDTTRTYPAGYPIIRDGMLYVCNQNGTTGTFDSNKWDAVKGRNDNSPITVEDPDGKGVTLSVEDGEAIISWTDGTETKTASLGVTTGRLRMTNPSPVGDAGDTAVLVKQDVPTTGDRLVYDETEHTFSRVEALPETREGLADGQLLYTEDVPFNRATMEMVEGRPRLIDEPTSNSLQVTDLVTRGDCDLRYKIDSVFPVGEWFTLGVVKVNARKSNPLAELKGFKFSNPSLGPLTFVATETNMDYISVPITGYLPSILGVSSEYTLSGLFINAHGVEKDNREFAENVLTTTGSGSGVFRVYSGDNGNWSSNIQDFDDQDPIWVEFKCLIEKV